MNRRLALSSRRIVCLKVNEYTLEMILDLVLDVVLILDEFDVRNEIINDDLLGRCSDVLIVDSLDSIEEVSNLRSTLESKGISPDYFFSGSEYGMYAKGLLEGLYGKLSRSPLAAVACRDKRFMKEIFGKLGIPAARYLSQYSAGEGLGDLSFPIVVKPSAGTGSYNTRKVFSEEELIDFITSETFHPALRARNWVLEEFIQGDEYHADIVWVDGEAKFVSLGMYLVPRIDIKKSPALNASFILPLSGNEELFDKVVDYQSKVLEEISFTNGISHTEFFVGKSNEVVFSEFALRAPGGYVPAAINAAYGIDVIKLWVHAELEESLEHLLAEGRSYAGAAGMSLEPMKDGLISRMPSRSDLMLIPGIQSVFFGTEVGEHVSSANPSKYSILLAFSSQTHFDAARRCEFVFEQYPIVVTAE